MSERTLSKIELEDLAFCEWMRLREPWALEQWKNAWRVETNSDRRDWVPGKAAAEVDQCH